MVESTDRDEARTANNAYVVVKEDKTPFLVVETNRGEESYELTPTAAGELRTAFLEGPQVRHDQGGA